MLMAPAVLTHKPIEICWQAGSASHRHSPAVEKDGVILEIGTMLERSNLCNRTPLCHVVAGSNLLHHHVVVGGVKTLWQRKSTDQEGISRCWCVDPLLCSGLVWSVLCFSKAIINLEDVWPSWSPRSLVLSQFRIPVRVNNKSIASFVFVSSTSATMEPVTVSFDTPRTNQVTNLWEAFRFS